MVGKGKPGPKRWQVRKVEVYLDKEGFALVERHKGKSSRSAAIRALIKRAWGADKT